MLVAGEAGIGKTALVEHALDDARSDGMQLLSAAGRELEQQYPYGVVLQLFERVVAADGAARSELLGGAASLAARLFATDANAGTPSAEAPAEPFPILHGLYWLVANLAERGPLVLAVDDAHWADLPSLRVLHYLAQRIEDLPLCLLLTVRSAQSAPPDAVVHPAELAQLTALEATETLRLRELSLTAVKELAGAEAAAEVWRATRGNPFLIGQLLQQRADQKGDDAVHSVLPETLSRWVLGRIDRAGRSARRVAEAIAVLGGAGSSATVAALAELDQDAVSRTVGALLTRGIVELRDGLSFVHPIVQSVVYESIAPLARGRMHFRTAHLLAGDPAGIDAAAVHLLSAPAAGDPWVVDLLAAAAGRANGRAATETAVRYLERAIAEPPESADRRRGLLIELARTEVAGGNAAAGVDHFDAALADTPPGRGRASVLYELGQARLGVAQWDAAARDYEAALGELHADSEEPDEADRALAAEIDAASIAADLMAMRHSEEVERRLMAALASPTLAPSARQLAASAAYRAATQALTPAAEQVALAHRALEGATVEELLRTGQTIELAAGVFLGADELETDFTLLDEAIEVAQRAGLYAKFCALSYCRSWPQLLTGQLAEAVTDGQAAVAGLNRGWETFYPAAASVLSMAHLERDELEDAERVLEMDAERWAGALDYLLLVPGAHARILEARGEIQAAIASFRQAEAVAAAGGLRNTGIILTSRAPLAILLAQVGERAEAQAIVAEELEVARAWDAPRFLGIGLRAASIVEGGERGIELLRESVEAFERSPALLEKIRAMLSLGQALRRAGRLTESREWLRRCLDLAQRCGATRMARQANEELRMAGARPRRLELSGVGALTPAELRVARMAASGRSNREVAQALFVTTKAVEYHLGNAYRKLGIVSRNELASALAGDEAEAAG